MKYLSYLFSFAKRVWISLIIGWLTPFLALMSYLRLDQSGALLVCAAIVSEVLHQKRHRRFVHQIRPGIKNTHMYLEVDVLGEDRKDIEVTAYQAGGGTTTVNTSSWALYHLAREKEFYPHGDSRMWDLDRTMTRLERRIDYAIVFTAIAGTILWAFT